MDAEGTRLSLQQVRRMLPDFAWALGASCKSPQQIIAAVKDELRLWREGFNPLTAGQVQALYNFLKKVEA